MVVWSEEAPAGDTRRRPARGQRRTPVSERQWPRAGPAGRWAERARLGTRAMSGAEHGRPGPGTNPVRTRPGCRQAARATLGFRQPAGVHCPRAWLPLPSTHLFLTRRPCVGELPEGFRADARLPKLLPAQQDLRVMRHLARRGG